MNVEKNSDYKELKKRHAPPSPILKNCLRAFFVGGFICFAAQWLTYLYLNLGIKENDAYTLTTVSIIFLAALLTAIGVFDNIARFSGAGTLLPVSGFANSVTSCAMDAKSEGFISGVGTKIFTVAGPVILYSTLAGTLYGVIYYFSKMLFMR